MQMETTLDKNLQQQNGAQHTACARSAGWQCNGARTWTQARRTRGRAGRSGGSEHAARQEERTRAQSRRAESTSQEAPRVKVKIWFQLLTRNNNNKEIRNRLQQGALSPCGTKHKGARGVSAWG